MNDKKLLRANALGEYTAENDRKLLLNNYIETPEYRSIIENKDSCVIVGRRGTGKSAMFLKLSDFWGSQKHTHVIQIAPEDYQTISFRSLFKGFEGDYAHTRAASKIIWRYGLLMELLSHLVKNYKVKDYVGDYPKTTEHTNRWSNNSLDFFSKLTLRISSSRLDSNQPILGALHSALEIKQLEDDLSNLLEISGVNFYILIDKLDEGYENDEHGAAIISGIISVISDLNKKYELIRTVLFQRDNIIRSVAKTDQDFTRNIESELIRIHWDSHQLLNLASKRLNTVFNLNIENAQRVWDRCTADESPERELRGTGGFKKCLQFTLYRPRDLLSLLNQSFFEAGKNDRETIVLSDVEVTAKNISELRLDDLKKEYKSIIPSILVALDLFANGNPELTYAEAIQILDMSTEQQSREIQIDFAILGSEGLLRALYSIGFLGIHDETSNSFNFCHDGRQPDREFEAGSKLLIHPCYWIGLNLTKNALTASEREEINDEYEIKVTSITPKIRAQKIGQLISQIGNIKEGRDDAEEFENWLFTAIQTVFAGHLSNVEAKPNGNAVQRRDIVGTNLANSSTWKRIRDTYGVSQVVFDAKNYKGVGCDEYRQLSTYLHHQYGSLGFIVCRDDDDNLRAGRELDWVQEIFTSQQKLIIKLSAKFFVRLLSKLRSPAEKHDIVDEALGKVLDTYERMYLSLQSTRAKKQ